MGLSFLGKKRYTILLVPVLESPSRYRMSHARYVAQGVGLIVRVLGLLEDDSSISGIAVNSQVRFIDDLVSTIPDLLEPIQQAVRRKQLSAGPWYVATLGLMVSGESLLRNLELGTHLLNTIAGMKPAVSYAPPVGNFSRQFPQMLASFGIPYAIADIGALSDSLFSVVVGPDGSRILVLSAPTPMLSPNALADGGRKLRDELVVGRDLLNQFDNAALQVMFYPVETEASGVSVNARIASATKHLRSSQVQTGTLGLFFTSIQNDYQEDSQPVVASQNILPGLPAQMDGVLSSRIWIAQENAEIQSLLEHWAEPLHAWAMLLGTGDVTSNIEVRFQQQLLGKAWKSLLQNQAYPEIAGAWVDALESEIRYRFNEARQIGEEVLSQSVATIAEAVNTASDVPAHAISALMVFNTNGFVTTDRVSARVRVDESAWPFEIVDSNGEAAAFQFNDYALIDGLVEADLDLLAKSVPGVGYTTYFIVPSQQSEGAVPDSDDLVSISNEYFDVRVDPQTGTLGLLDKEQDLFYEGLNHFIDVGDRGNVLKFDPVPSDTIIDIAANTPLAMTRKVSSLGESLEFFQIYRVPSQLADDRKSRLPLSAQFAPLSIFTRVYLTYGIRRIDIEVEISNDARDHKLQVSFPTPYPGNDCWVDAQFEVAHIPVGSDAQAVRFSQQDFVSMVGDHSGITVANRGIPEVSVQHAEGHSDLRLTLMRSVGLIQGSAEENLSDSESLTAQCLGSFDFAYSMIPHGTLPLVAWNEARSFCNPLLGIQAGLHDGVLPRTSQLVGTDSGLFVLSAVRASERRNAIIVRGYSISDHDEEVTLTTAMPVKEATELSLSGEPIGTVPIADPNHIQFSTGPHQIKTLELDLDL